MPRTSFSTRSSFCVESPRFLFVLFSLSFTGFTALSRNRRARRKTHRIAAG
jgi:hypothetical protein